MNKIIAFRDVTHIFPGSKSGLQNISFDVNKGEFIVLAGKNGSGKTTLLRHINVLISPSEGEILIDGKPAASPPLETRKKIGMIFQDADTQIVAETVFDEVAFGLENLKYDRNIIDQKVNQTLESLDLLSKANRNPSTLSGGEKRKLAIAGVLVMDPEVILLDEPFSNLDFPGTKTLFELLISLHTKGITLIIATHDIEKIIEKASRMIIMDNGRIVEDGIPTELMDRVEQYGIKEPCSSKFNLGLQSWIN